MKTLIFTFCFALTALVGFGQWISVETPVTKHLYAVSFCDANHGIAAGEAGTIITTNDGGMSWAQISSPNEDLRSVCMVNPQLIFVGGNDLYRSDDGGATWTVPGIQSPKSLSFTNDLNGICTGITGVFQTADGGVTWSQCVQGGTTVYESSADFDQTAIAMGNVGGFISYSAAGMRSEAGVWHHFDFFSFPNANAYVSVHFPTPDTAYLFMNQFSHWVPSEHNQFVRLTGFELVGDLSGELIWVFQSETLNEAIPDYMQSVYFVNANEGYACGEKGSIYKTINGGIDWVADYTGNSMLWKMQFVNDAVAYAVGNDGTLLKHDLTTNITNPESPATFTLYPNPAKETCTVNTNGNACLLEIIATQGTVVLSQHTPKGQPETILSLNTLTPGIYLLRSTTGSGTTTIQKLVIQ